MNYHILVDMDDVTCDLSTPWEAWIKENGDPEFSSENISTWYVNQHTKIGKKAYEFLATPGVFLNLQAKKGAILYIKKLREDGHRIQFCTSPPENHPTAKEEKTEWLKHHFKWFNPETDVIFSNNKTEEDGDILFDDRVKWCFEFPGKAVCMARPWNKYYEGFRVYTWQEFYDLVQMFRRYKTTCR